MKKYLQSGMCALVVLAAPVRGECSSIVTAHVLSVGTYGNGNVYIALDQTIDQPDCNAPYLAIERCRVGGSGSCDQLFGASANQ